MKTDTKISTFYLLEECGSLENPKKGGEWEPTKTFKSLKAAKRERIKRDKILSCYADFPYRIKKITQKTITSIVFIKE